MAAGISYKIQIRDQMVDLGLDTHSKILAANFSDLPPKTKKHWVMAAVRAQRYIKMREMTRRKNKYKKPIEVNREDAAVENQESLAFDPSKNKCEGVPKEDEYTIEVKREDAADENEESLLFDPSKNKFEGMPKEDEHTIEVKREDAADENEESLAFDRSKNKFEGMPKEDEYTIEVKREDAADENEESLEFDPSKNKFKGMPKENAYSKRNKFRNKFKGMPKEEAFSKRNKLRNKFEGMPKEDEYPIEVKREDAADENEESLAVDPSKNKFEGMPKEDEYIASESSTAKSKSVNILCSDQVSFPVVASESSTPRSKSGDILCSDQVSFPVVASDSRTRKPKSVQILCSDQVSFPVGQLFASESCVVRNRMTYGFVSPVRLEFASPIISPVLDFCKKHAETRKTDDKDVHEKLRFFNSQFLKENHCILVDLLRVSLRLQIRSLLELMSEAVVDMINEKTAEEIHKMLNMEQDLNPEDIELLLELDGWCFK